MLGFDIADLEQQGLSGKEGLSEKEALYKRRQAVSRNRATLYSHHVHGVIMFVIILYEENSPTHAFRMRV